MVSTEVVEKDAVVSGVNSVAEEASRLETRLIALAKENAYLKGPSLASYIAPGPYRSASARGTAITLCKLSKVGSMRCSSVESELYTLLGYTFRVWCGRNTETKPTSYCFRLLFCRGLWDSFLVWPFSKRIVFVIPHLRDESKDIRLEVSENSLRGYLQRSKPQVNEPNCDIWFESVTEEQILIGSFFHDDDLYVNIEFV